MIRKFLIGVVLLALLLLGGSYFYLRSSLQPVSCTFQLAGLDGEVEIVRDRYGIPHITAKSFHDALFAQGFVHAQDRLWQMEMNRRIGEGRLAEMFGEKVVDTDKFLRVLDLVGVARRTWPKMDAKTRAAMTAYARGVNAAIANWSGALPPEFLILGVTPGKWEPVHSLTWLKIMAWDLGANWRKELLRLQLLKKGFSVAKINEFLPPYPGEAPVNFPDFRSLYADLAPTAQKLLAKAPRFLGRGEASNNWVVAGKRSQSGKPLLANDPHLGLSAPSVWYYVHLKAPGVDAIGASFPGVPGIILGRNQQVAWAFTNTGPDVQDLFVEKLVPEKPGHYLTPDGPRPFETRKTVIKVKGGKDVTLTVRKTRHGPVISDVIPPVPGLSKNYVLSLAWTTLRDDDMTARAALYLMTVRDWDSMLANMRDFHSPQQNILYADKAGNIGYLAPARVPIRKPENKAQGLVPVPGWDATYDWAGFIPYEELPRRFNPPEGVMNTSNEKVVGPDYPHHITHEWTLPYRGDRVRALLAKTERHDRQSFQAIQADIYSAMAAELLPLMIQALPPSRRNDPVVQRLQKWDFVMRAERPEPLVFLAWLRQLAKRVYGDDLGPLFQKNWWEHPRFLANVLGNVNGQAHWCDDVTTQDKRESCALQAAAALDAALARLKKKYGEDPTQWRWTDAHYALSAHKPFSKVSPLNRIFDITVPAGGGRFTVNKAQFKMHEADRPFVTIHGPSLRAIYDLSDLDKSVFVFSTGQSGNPFSPHYKDMATLWSRHQYVPLTTKRADYEKDMLGRIRLKAK